MQGLNQYIYIPGNLYYESRDITLAKLQINNLIMIRWPVPPKRYYLAIEALKYIFKEVPDCKLTIVSNSNQNLIKLSKSNLFNRARKTC